MRSAEPHPKDEVVDRGAARERLWEAGLVVGFLLLCGFDILHHAMWRDEMQPWLFARDSASIADLFRNMHYETHPRLWYLLLFGITRVTSNPVAMQGANLLIMGGAMAVFVRFCPMELTLKALTVFGIYFVGEWGMVSRNYAVGVLFCFAFCAWFPRRDKGYLGLAVMLFLATQSNLYTAVLAGGLFGLLVLEAWIDPEARGRIARRKTETAVSALLVIGGGAVAIWNAIPKPDIDPNLDFFAKHASHWDKVKDAFAAAWDAFFVAPWNIEAIGHSFLGDVGFHAMLGVIFLPITALFFRRSRLILWTYLCGAGLLLVFAYIKVDNYPRHAGHFFLWFLICLWLTYYLPGAKPFSLLFQQKLLLCSILILQVCGTAFISVRNYSQPFSNSKTVAEYLEEHHIDGYPIMGYPDYVAMPVLGYLPKVRFYYPDTQRWGTFVIENNKRQTDWEADRMWQAIQEFAGKGHRDFYVLLGEPLTFMRNGNLYEVTKAGDMRRETSFVGSIVGENYWLYHYQAAGR